MLKSKTIMPTLSGSLYKGSSSLLAGLSLKIQSREILYFCFSIFSACLERFLLKDLKQCYVSNYKRKHPIYHVLLDLQIFKAFLCNILLQQLKKLPYSPRLTTSQIRYSLKDGEKIPISITDRVQASQFLDMHPTD